GSSLPDRIVFVIGSGGPQVITLGRALPNLKDAVVIDGTTQPGWGASLSGWVEKPVIVLKNGDPADSLDGLSLTAGGSAVRGLEVRGFTNGVAVSSSGNVLADDFLAGNTTGLRLYAGASGNTV